MILLEWMISFIVFLSLTRVSLLFRILILLTITIVFIRDFFQYQYILSVNLELIHSLNSSKVVSTQEKIDKINEWITKRWIPSQSETSIDEPPRKNPLHHNIVNDVHMNFQFQEFICKRSFKNYSCMSCAILQCISTSYRKYPLSKKYVIGDAFGTSILPFCLKSKEYEHSDASNEFDCNVLLDISDLLCINICCVHVKQQYIIVPVKHKGYKYTIFIGYNHNQTKDEASVWSALSYYLQHKVEYMIRLQDETMNTLRKKSSNKSSNKSYMFNCTLSKDYYNADPIQTKSTSTLPRVDSGPYIFLDV